MTDDGGRVVREGERQAGGCPSLINPVACLELMEEGERECA